MVSRKHVFFILAVLVFVGGCVSQVIRDPKPEPSPSEQTIFEDRFRATEFVRIGYDPLEKIPFFGRYFTSTTEIQGFIWDFFPAYAPGFGVSYVVSEDGNWLLIGEDQGGAVSVFSLQEPRDHKFYLVPSKNDGQFRNVHLGSAGEVSFVTHNVADRGSQVAWMAFTPDCSAFLVYRINVTKDYPKTDPQESMELFDRETGALLRTFSIEPGFHCGAVTPDGESLLCVGKSVLESWNLRTGEKTASILLPDLRTEEPVQLRCSPDNRFAFIAFRNRKVLVYDLATSEQTTILGESGPVLVDVSPDGGTLLVASSTIPPESGFPEGPKPSVLKPVELMDVTINLYEMGTWKPIREIRPKYPHPHGFRAVRFSEDAKQILARGVERFETKKWRRTETTIKTFLAEYDLSDENTSQTWTPLEYRTLPLHPAGKRLLNGPLGFGTYLAPFREVLEIGP